MSKIFAICLFIWALSLHFLPVYSDPVTEQLLQEWTTGSSKPELIDYGYNKFTPSPYTKKIQVVPFSSADGIALFERSKYKTAFFKLAPHYVPQQTITNCGIASAIIILNTLYAENKKTPPLSIQGSHFDPEKNAIYGQFIWTENNFYTKAIKSKLDKEVVEGNKKVEKCFVLGVTLDQLTETLKIQGTDAKAYPVTTVTKEGLNQFRELVKSSMAKANPYLIAHYSLGLYLQDEGGHFSPISAYDDLSDSVLILDTWAAANGWIWVKLEDLYRSMQTLDGKTYRGYILINSQIP